MKIVVIGGHFTPALAVVEKLKEHEILFIGRKYALEGDKALSFEYQEIQKLGIKFKSLIAGRLQRKFTIHTIPSLLKFPVGFFQSLFILRSFKPDVILGFGGYVQLPVIFSAAILRIPIIIHEQALTAGLANKIASHFASKVCISWKSSENSFPKEKIVLTGNPIRKEIIQALTNDSKQSSIHTIYITGGSLGSHALNQLVEGSLNRLSKSLRIIHQTGDAKEFKDFERLSFLREDLENKNHYFIKKFLNAAEVGEVLKKVDLVVSRAGINTITELIYLNKPCFLIPLPQGKEQKINAEFVKGLGLAEVREEEELNPTIFIDAIKNMFADLNGYKTAENILLQNPEEKIGEVVVNVGKKA